MEEAGVCRYAYINGLCVKDVDSCKAAIKCSYPDCEYSKSEDFQRLKDIRQQHQQEYQKALEDALRNPAKERPMYQSVNPESFHF